MNIEVSIKAQGKLLKDGYGKFKYLLLRPVDIS